MDQIAFGRQQGQVIKQIGETLREMKSGQVTLIQRVTQLKRKQIEISHRVLKLLRHHEVHRRSGFAISVEEEQLRSGLERIWSELTSPRGLRVRLHDIRATIDSSTTDSDKTHTSSASEKSGACDSVNWDLDADSWAELKEYLSQRQNGLREMQYLVNEMSSTLKLMERSPASVKPINSLVTRPPYPRSLSNKVSFALNTHL